MSQKGNGWHFVRGSRRVSGPHVKMQVACEACMQVQEVFLWSFSGTGKACEECKKLMYYARKLDDVD